MKKRMRKKLTQEWEWYSAKILYECSISGGRPPETLEAAPLREHRTFEEILLLIKAPSEEVVYAFAEKEAKKQEVDYLNSYGQKVEWRFVKAIDCFNLFTKKLQPGTELYARFLFVPENILTEEVISHYYPETVSEQLVDKNFIRRIPDIT